MRPALFYGSAIAIGALASTEMAFGVAIGAIACLLMEGRRG